MPASWNRNRLTAKLGIDYPIIQGPFGGFSSQRLTAEVSNFGGLGSLGANALAPEAIKDVIAEIRSLNWEQLVQRTNRIRQSDLRIRFASCWTRRCRYSVSFSGFRQEKSWRSAGRRASSRLARRQHPMRPRHFRRPAWMPSPLPASKPVGIALHSSGPRKIRSRARCRSSLRLWTSSMCR
jgi:NAD(P)H-dependent flavin oxidoreductase YrpB (nitropropane dioxygenase family)